MEDFMQAALDQARLAYCKQEVPVGAVIVKNGQIVAAAHNLKETLKDVTAHAEILAIRKAEALLDNWRLSGCSMYVTLEPCAMCASAIAQSRISNLYIGAPDIDRGACGSINNIIEEDSINNHVKVFWTYNEDCSELITNFFRNRR